MKYKTIKKKDHYIFDNVKEFEDWFREQDGVVPKLVKNWRDAKQGDWVIADDGGVVQILMKRELPHPHDRPNYKAHKGYCRTCVGTFIQNDKTFMDTDFNKHPDPWSFGGKATPTEQRRRVKNRKDLTKKERVFCMYIIAGHTLQDAWEKSFGPSAYWYEKAIFLLKQERILKKVKEDVKNKLNEKFGGDVIDFIFDNLVELVEIAKKKENPTALLSALKEIGDWSGEKEKDKKIVTGQAQVTFQPFDDKELGKIEAEEVKVLTEADDD